MLSGAENYPIVAITTQLLTAIHGALIRLHQVSKLSPAAQPLLLSLFVAYMHALDIV